MTKKTLRNTDTSKAKDNVKDIEFWGNGDMWKLLSKASSTTEGWMKSSKAMEIPGSGCAVQVTTQQGDNVAEAVVFIPNVYIHAVYNDRGEVIARSLVDEREAAATMFISKVFTKDGETYRVVSADRDVAELELVNRDGSGNPSKRLNILAGELEIIAKRAIEADRKAMAENPQTEVQSIPSPPSPPKE